MASDPSQAEGEAGMSGIKRYDSNDSCEEVSDGDYVKFADHADEIARLRAEVDALRVDAGRMREMMDHSFVGTGFVVYGTAQSIAEVERRMDPCVGGDIQGLPHAAYKTGKLIGRREAELEQKPYVDISQFRDAVYEARCSHEAMKREDKVTDCDRLLSLIDAALGADA